MKYAPDFITSAFAHDRVEQGRDFRINLFTLAILKGYSVLEPRGEKEEEEERKEVDTKELEENLKEFKDTRDGMLYEEIKDSHNELFAEADKAVRSKTATQRDRMVCTVHHTLKHFEEPLEYDQYQVANKHLVQIKNIACAQKYSSDDIVEIKDLINIDVKGLEKRQWAELTKFQLFTELFRLTGDILCIKLEFSSIFDTETIIPKTKLSDNKSDILEVCNKMSLLRGVKPRVICGEDDANVAKTAINRELKALFACSLKRKQVWVGSRDERTKATVYYIGKDDRVHELVGKSDYFKEDDEFDQEWSAMVDDMEENDKTPM